MARRGPPPKEYWPSWRYGPYGESKIFNSADEVPDGWAKKPQDAFVPTAPVHLDRDQLISDLQARGITPLGHWSMSYMKELLNQ